MIFRSATASLFVIAAAGDFSDFDFEGSASSDVGTGRISVHRADDRVELEGGTDAPFNQGVVGCVDSGRCETSESPSDVNVRSDLRLGRVAILGMIDSIGIKSHEGAAAGKRVQGKLPSCPAGIVAFFTITDPQLANRLEEQPARCPCNRLYRSCPLTVPGIVLAKVWHEPSLREDVIAQVHRRLTTETIGAVFGLGHVRGARRAPSTSWFPHQRKHTLVDVARATLLVPQENEVTPPSGLPTGCNQRSAGAWVMVAYLAAVDLFLLKLDRDEAAATVRVARPGEIEPDVAVASMQSSSASRWCSGQPGGLDWSSRASAAQPHE